MSWQEERILRKEGTMLKIEEMTTYICDGCGERFHDENGCVGYIDYDIWNDAESSEWQEIDGKHYCPNCCEYDEETDAYIPKKGGQK